MRIHTTLIGLLGAVALVACGDKAERDISGPVPTASAVRFFNFGVNAPGVYFFANDQKLTATISASCRSAANPPVTANDSICVQIGIQDTIGVKYGAVAAGGLYTGIAPGQYTLNGRILMQDGAASSTISSLPATIESGKSYSYYQSGFYDKTAKTVDAFVVEDPLPTTIDWTTASVRFVNAISNSQPMTLYLVNADSKAESVIGGPVAYKSAGAFTAVPPASYDLHARDATGTDKIVRTFIGFLPGHSYTITAYGDMTVTSTTSANRPQLDNTANQ